MDIWGASVKPYDMGEKYSSFFSSYLGTACKLAYVNVRHPRYIQGPLPPLYCQNGNHPQTGLSDGAPYLFIPVDFLANIRVKCVYRGERDRSEFENGETNVRDSVPSKHSLEGGQTFR